MRSGRRRNQLRCRRRCCCRRLRCCCYCCCCEDEEKKERERNESTNFVVCASILFRNDLATRPKGVLAAAARHKALLIPP